MYEHSTRHHVARKTGEMVYSRVSWMKRPPALIAKLHAHRQIAFSPGLPPPAFAPRTDQPYLIAIIQLSPALHAVHQLINLLYSKSPYLKISL
jgi:hypothetical protein